MDLYKKLLTPFWVILALGLIVALAYAWVAISMQRSVEAYFEAPPEVIDTTRPAILQGIRSLGRLETTTYQLDKIIPAGTTGGNFFQQAWYKDHLLLIARGEVIAGFDLKALPADAVVVTATQVSINLGAPKILVSRLDNKGTQVYQRTVGTFNSPDKDLESRARLKAEISLRRAACQGEILQRAMSDGKQFMQTFTIGILQAIGSQREVVVTADLPKTCR